MSGASRMWEERRVDAESLKALAGFLPKFEAPGFEFGSWESGWFSPSQEALDFISACYESGWMKPDFDWPAWAGTDEASRLRDDPAAIENATPEQLSRILTVMVRQDRFVEGSLGGHFESGLIVRIVRRIANLAEVMPNE
ncbi:MAG: hypothetical protein F4Y02_01690 [Chloroflexi bacterium]|nr:hypothetical protein [Chloroflexota bacterium]